MSFHSPITLAALGALLLPVIIHLLNKVRVRQIHWAATRFLNLAVRHNQRRIRYEDLLLLLLRCLLLALLILTFARPTLHHPGQTSPTDTSAGTRTLMILLDNSASMGATNGLETRFATAQTTALHLLENLPSGSTAGLLLVNDRYTSPIPHPTTDLALVRRTVELARLTDRSTHLAPAIRAAADILKKHPPPTEILLLTDNQQTAWHPGDTDTLRQHLSTIPGLTLSIQIPPPPPSPADAPNLAITGLHADTTLPIAGQPLRILAEITNTGTTPARDIRVTLALDDAPPSASTVIETLPPGGTHHAPLLIRLTDPGYHTLTASLAPDRLEFDNHRTLAIHAPPPRQILILETRTGPASWQGTGHFLAAALAPVPSQNLDTHYLRITRTTTLPPPGELSRFTAIYLCSPPPPH